MLIPDIKNLTDCASLDEGRKLVLNSPINGESVRCLVADHMMCQNLVEKYPKLGLLEEQSAHTEIRLPIAMAVHEGESRLLSLLDSCVKLLELSSFFAHLYRYDADASTLARMGVLTPDVVKRTRQPR